MEDRDWKLELRYGKTTTPFHHFTLIADGVVGDLADGFDCRPGAAVMSMKVWATDAAEAIEMIAAIGRQIGFAVTGKIEVFGTAPDQPPRENPHGYAIGFVPYDAR